MHAFAHQVIDACDFRHLLRDLGCSPEGKRGPVILGSALYVRIVHRPVTSSLTFTFQPASQAGSLPPTCLTITYIQARRSCLGPCLSERNPGKNGDAEIVIWTQIWENVWSCADPSELYFSSACFLVPQGREPSETMTHAVCGKWSWRCVAHDSLWLTCVVCSVSAQRSGGSRTPPGALRTPPGLSSLCFTGYFLPSASPPLISKALCWPSFHGLLLGPFTQLLSSQTIVTALKDSSEEKAVADLLSLLHPIHHQPSFVSTARLCS